MREREKVKMEIRDGKVYFFSCVQGEGKEMEKVKLEGILEKLEKIDIHCWDIITKKRSFDIINTTLTAENSGLKFYLDEDCLSIEDLETGYTINYQKAMEEFYQKTYAALRGYYNSKIEEKLKNFLTD